MEVFLRNAFKGLLHLGIVDFDFINLGLLNFQRFVDQITQNLQTETVDFLGRQLVVIGRQIQRQTLIDVGAGDDVAVDNRGGAAKIGVALAKDRDVGGDRDLPLRGRGGHLAFILRGCIAGKGHAHQRDAQRHQPQPRKPALIGRFRRPAFTKLIHHRAFDPVCLPERPTLWAFVELQGGALTEAERARYLNPILRNEKWIIKLDPFAASPMLT